MASSLTSATQLARKAIVVFIIFAILTFVLQFVGTWFSGNNPFQPTPTPTPPYVSANELLGPIPRPQAKSIQLPNGTQASYALDGAMPSMPPVINIYEIQTPHDFLGNTGIAEQVAQNLGFLSKDYKTAGNVLSWQVPKLTRLLQYNTELLQWKFEVTAPDKDTNTSQIHGLVSSDQNYYPNLASALLGQINISPISNFSSASSRIDYVNMDSQRNLTKVLSADKAQYARIALYKKVEASTLRSSYKIQTGDQNIYQTYNADVRKYNYLDGVANFIVQGDAKDMKKCLIDFNFTNFIYTGRMGVYSLLSPTDAWNNIQANQGYLYWFRRQDQNVFSPQPTYQVTQFTANTSKIKLIYIEPDSYDANALWTHYLQPFYLFEGIATLVSDPNNPSAPSTADFAFIVPALQPSEYLVENK